MGAHFVRYRLVKVEVRNHVLTLRVYTYDDFPLIESWWRQHHGNDIRPGYFSSAAFIPQVDGVDAGFFSMHPMACDFCYLGFPMVNPTLGKESREKTVDYIIEAAKLWAKAAGIPIVYISTHGENFLNRLGKAGFIADGSNNTHMFCKVGNIA